MSEAEATADSYRQSCTALTVMGTDNDWGEKLDHFAESSGESYAKMNCISLFPSLTVCARGPRYFSLYAAKPDMIE